MDDLKDALRGTINSITPEFLMTWDINSTMDRIVDESAPTLHRLLESGIVCDVIVAQFANQRSHHSLYLAAPFTMTLWTNGASRQTIETLAKSHSPRCRRHWHHGPWIGRFKLLKGLISSATDEPAPSTKVLTNFTKPPIDGLPHSTGWSPD
ncbi:hypothetical protein BDN67DRAFT_1002331 [Paxillus ammoniavirescens]|nr:hypothetical protein BDN67DRAFT_1002331 [Paxillus ammoniavirescens]